MIQVTAAIISDADRILICKRGAGGSCAFLWEFPGGKLEPGETPEECLIRECKEELEVDVELGGLFGGTRYKYPEKEVLLRFYHARIVGGIPKLKVHSDLRWVRPAELCGYSFCPADKEITEKLAGEQQSSEIMYE